MLSSERPAPSRLVAEGGRRSLRREREAGFTLLELVIVMAIIALMAALIAPMLFNRLKESKVKVSQAQIEMLGTALDSYRLDVGRYPSTEQGLQALIEQPQGMDNWTGPYLRKSELPKDGWGKDFIYHYPPDAGDKNKSMEYSLFSLGADGKPGGDGDDADVYP